MDLLSAVRNSLRVLTLSTLSLASINSLAQSSTGAESNPNLYDLTLRSAEIGWLPGETYDTRTGQMNHVMTDLVFEGNGLPITVTRSIIQGDRRGINLSFPKLKFFNRTINGAPSHCSRPNVSSPNGFVFEDANTKESFTSMSSINSALIHFPGNAKYVSKNNWIIRCDDDVYTVLTPAGLEYRFDFDIGHDPNKPIPSGNGGEWEVLHVSKISDLHGNFLEFNYAGYVAPSPGTGSSGNNTYQNGRIIGVSRIKASDGRIVHIRYDDVTTANNWSYINSTVANKRVSQVYTNGGPNNRSINYRRTQYGYDVDHGLGKIYKYRFNYLKSDMNILSSVEYPTGGTVAYTYSRYSQDIISDKNITYPLRQYYPLIKRTISGTNVTPGSWLFSSHNNVGGPAARTFSRIITTPSNTIEYRFRKTGWYRDYHDGGKLLSQKVFLNRLDNWTEYSVPLVEVKNRYDVIFDLVPGTVFRNYRQVLKSETTTRVYGIDENDPNRVRANSSLLFKRTFYYDNSTGANPERLLRSMVEQAPGSRFRSNKYVYESTKTPYLVGLPKRIDSSSGDVTIFDYYNDGVSNGLVKFKSVNGIETSFTYNNGMLETTSSGGKSRTTKNYFRGVPRIEKDGDGRTKTRVINSDGTLVSESIWNSSDAYRYEYDKLHRVKKITYPGSVRGDTTYLYPSHNKVVEYQPSNVSATTETDGFGREILFNRAGKVGNAPFIRRATAKKYDAEGQLVKSTYPTNLYKASYSDYIAMPGVEYQYDGAGRRIKSEEFLNLNSGAKRTREWARTVEGNREKLRFKNGRNSIETHYFQSFGSPKQEYLVSTIDGNGIETTYSRDTSGRLLSMTRNGKTRTYEYNGRKELRSEYHPESKNTAYTYYSDGLLRTSINSGRIATYSYANDNQLRKVVWSDSRSSVTLQYYYDSHGRLQSTERNATDSAFSVYSAYGYDAMGNVLYEKNSDTGGNSLQMSYQYNDLGHLARMTYPNGNTYALEPNAFGAKSLVEGLDGKSILSSVSYHANGMYSIIESGASSLRSGRDDMFRIDSRQHRKDDNRDVHYSYAYDEESNMSWLKNQMNGASQSMFYDGGGRLKGVQGARIGQHNFEYNARDDIISRKLDGVEFVYGYNWRGHLTKITSPYPTRTMEYNDHGEVTGISMYQGNQPNSLKYLTLTRDPEGRLVGTGEGSRYGYDHRGLRFIKEKNGRTFTYYDLGGKLRYRWDQVANVETEYHYVGNELIAKRERYATANAGSPPTSGSGEGSSPNVDQVGIYSVNHTTKTISWTSPDWHQVQKSNGTGIGCDGVSVCEVPEPGDYIVINHKTSVRTAVTVRDVGGNEPESSGQSGSEAGGSSSESVTVQGDYTINHSNFTISWTVSGWHQVQETASGNYSEICAGSNSCNVQKAGKYVVINHATGNRETIDVGNLSGGEASSTTQDPVSVVGKTISWTDEGWYQVQENIGPDYKQVCAGGSSCTVTSAGQYIVINHSNQRRITVTVK